MGPDESADTICVTVVYSPEAGRTDEVVVLLPVDSPASLALVRSGMRLRHPELDPSSAIGIWSQRCTPETVLRDQDRLEIYRPLQVEPKEARRLRQQKQRGITLG